MALRVTVAFGGRLSTGTQWRHSSAPGEAATLLPGGMGEDAEGPRVTVDRAYALPAAELLAVLDEDAQGWAIAQAVRDGDAIVDFVLVYLNEAGAEILGRPRAEVLGRRYRDLWPETMNDGTLPLYANVVHTRR